MRKEIIATLLISAIWAIAGFLTAYSAWEMGIGAAFPQLVEPRLPDPFGLGILSGVVALCLTFIILRTMLPSRATQRRRLLRLLDEIGVDDLDAIQHKLSAVSTQMDDPDEIERATSLRALLQEQKRKNQAD